MSNQIPGQDRNQDSGEDVHLLLTNRACLGRWASTQSLVYFIREQQEAGEIGGSEGRTS